jgi:hypothetical protein
MVGSWIDGSSRHRPCPCLCSCHVHVHFNVHFHVYFHVYVHVHAGTGTWSMFMSMSIFMFMLLLQFVRIHVHVHVHLYAQNHVEPVFLPEFRGILPKEFRGILPKYKLIPKEFQLPRNSINLLPWTPCSFYLRLRIRPQIFKMKAWAHWITYDHP